MAQKNGSMGCTAHGQIQRHEAAESTTVGLKTQPSSRVSRAPNILNTLEASDLMAPEPTMGLAGPLPKDGMQTERLSCSARANPLAVFSRVGFALCPPNFGLIGSLT